MTEEQEREALRLLRVAASAANKLALNRSFYKYEWMKYLSQEAVALEDQLPALEAFFESLGRDWREI